MTTQASEVSISVSFPLSTESDNFSIDWGDGKKFNMDNTTFISPYFDYVAYNFEHSYSDVSEHHITITGDNIVLLDCPKNQLTTLNVSNYHELRGLSCWENQLTTLDLSKNTALGHLNCNWNQLTSLDVSRHTELWGLFCSWNQLKNINVSLQNTVLDRLECDNNQLPTYALNDLFRSLHGNIVRYTKHSGTIPDFLLVIHDNPGTNDCDVSIAQKKGWVVR